MHGLGKLEFSWSSTWVGFLQLFQLTPKAAADKEVFSLPSAFGWTCGLPRGFPAQVDGVGRETE
jgi:hypothetical protein